VSTTKSSVSKTLLSPFSLAFLVLLLGIAIQLTAIPSLTGPPAPNKPYSTFQAFYPFYQSEHSNEVNRKLHFAGTTVVIALFLMNPRSVPSLLMGVVVGLVLCPMLRGVPTGFIELALVMMTFIGTHKISTGKIGVAVLIPIVGYGCAWFGHFFHELNRPATFIYPTYSLLGDFQMWFRVATGKEAF